MESQEIAGERIEPVPVPRHVERRNLFVCVLLYFVLRLWGLWGIRVNRLFDEGVHLSLMRMLATGQGVLYRDLFFIHPPGLIHAGAWVWSLSHGDLFVVRLTYVLFCSLTILPLYALARFWFGVRVALVALLLFAVTPGLAGWLGQSVFLEQPLNVFVYFALWLLLGNYRERSWSAVLAGAVMGLAFLVKETVSLAGAGCLVAWLVSLRTPLGEKGTKPYLSARQFLLFVLAWSVALGSVVAVLSGIPHYMRDTVLLNARDPYILRSRFYEFQNGLFQLPFQLTFGIAGLWLLFRGRASRAERFLGAFGLVVLCLVFLTPKRFFWRHFILVMPLCGIGVALCWERVIPLRRKAMRVGLVLCGLVSLVTLSLYHLSERRNPASFGKALTLLSSHEGALFTLDPIWAVSSGRPLPHWQYACDSIFAFQFDLVRAEEVASVVRSCPLVLLNRKTVEVLPHRTLEMIQREYRSLFKEGVPGESNYIEVLERRK